MSCASLRWVQLYQRGFVPLIPVARAATGGGKTRDGLAYEALNLMPNLLSSVRLLLAGARVLPGAVQRGLGAAGGRAGARAAGDGVDVVARVRREDQVHDISTKFDMNTRIQTTSLACPRPHMGEATLRSLD